MRVSSCYLLATAIWHVGRIAFCMVQTVQVLASAAHDLWHLQYQVEAFPQEATHMWAAVTATVTDMQIAGQQAGHCHIT